MDKDHDSVMLITWGDSFAMVPAVESLFAKAEM